MNLKVFHLCSKKYFLVPQISNSHLYLEFPTAEYNVHHSYLSLQAHYLNWKQKKKQKKKGFLDEISFRKHKIFIIHSFSLLGF